MTEPVDFTCPNCLGTDFTGTWQVYASLTVVKGKPVAVEAAPTDASDFFVSFTCDTCHHELNSSGEGRTHRGNLQNRNGDEIDNDTLFDGFVRLADAATEIVAEQSLRTVITG